MTLRIRSLPASPATDARRRDVGDAGHARHLGADQADHFALAKTALSLGDQHFGRAITNRAIHETGRAEAASPLASAARFDQEHVAEDAFLGENQRRCAEAVEVAKQASIHLPISGAAL